MTVFYHGFVRTPTFDLKEIERRRVVTEKIIVEAINRKREGSEERDAESVMGN